MDNAALCNLEEDKIERKAYRYVDIMDRCGFHNEMAYLDALKRATSADVRQAVIQAALARTRPKADPKR